MPRTGHATTILAPPCRSHLSHGRDHPGRTPQSDTASRSYEPRDTAGSTSLRLSADAGRPADPSRARANAPRGAAPAGPRHTLNRGNRVLRTLLAWDRILGSRTLRRLASWRQISDDDQHGEAQDQERAGEDTKRQGNEHLDRCTHGLLLGGHHAPCTFVPGEVS